MELYKKIKTFPTYTFGSYIATINCFQLKKLKNELCDKYVENMSSDSCSDFILTTGSNFYYPNDVENKETMWSKTIGENYITLIIKSNDKVITHFNFKDGNIDYDKKIIIEDDDIIMNVRRVMV